MGLDITFYENVQWVGKRGEDDDEYYDRGEIFLYPTFTKQADGLDEGLYTESGQSGGFRAGSYGGYSHFREQLCMMVHTVATKVVWSNLEEYRDKPFFSLINFSDCEGFIGPKTSAELASYFVIWDEFAKEALDEYCYEVYSLFKNAFETAADSGVVQFC